MKKLFILIAFLLAISFTPQSYASDKIAGRSATLSQDSTRQDDTKLSKDVRVTAIQNVLKKYDSILVGEAKHYVYYADKHGIDWRLLVSISGLESYFGARFVPGTYNAYGWGGGYIYFESWEEGIDKISYALKKNYYDKGANTVYKIGPIYAESPHWAERVTYFMSQIDEEYSRLTTLSIAPQF